MAARDPGGQRPRGDQYTWEELPEAIEALQNGDDIDYQGASGPIDLDEAATRPPASTTSTSSRTTVPEAVDEVEVATPGA